MKNFVAKLGFVVNLCVLIAFAIAGPMIVQGWRQARALPKVFPAYAQALINKDPKSAYAFVSPEFANAMSYAEFIAQQQIIENRCGDLKTVREGYTTVAGHGKPMHWVGQVNATLVFSRGEMKMLYEFHLENSQWRLFGYKEL